MSDLYHVSAAPSPPRATRFATRRPAVLGLSRTPIPASTSGTVFRDIETLPGGDILVSYEDALAAVIRAQEEAERLLHDAYAEAHRIAADAKKKATQVRAEARNKGYVEGQDRAESEARAAATTEMQTAVAELRADLEAFCEAVLAEQKRVWQEAEGKLCGLALEIAERVVKAEVTVNPEVVLQITRHAMRRLADKDQVRIRVNPADVERLRDHRDDLMALFEGLHAVEILEDRRVGIGGAQIETDTGTVDARIESQLGEVHRLLEE